MIGDATNTRIGPQRTESDVKIVPEKPTPEMEDAGTDAAKCYEAMIAVAPMPTAVWEDGSPANLLAAGEDAYAWLSWLQQHARTFLMEQEDQRRLENCMVALNSFLRPSAHFRKTGESWTNDTHEPGNTEPAR